MKKLKIVALSMVCVWIFSSIILSVVYAVSSDPWEVAINRNGCFIAIKIESGFAVLSPFTNFGDDYLVIVRW